MVWSQYILDSTTGLDAYASDEEDLNDDTPLNIHDWEVKYSDELWMMWNTIRTLFEDATLTHSGEYWDFVEFCFMEHDYSVERVTWEYEEQTRWYEERLSHVWRNTRRIVNQHGLHEEMLRGASFYDFADYAKNYMRVY
jgi:hypothetical protein